MTPRVVLMMPAPTRTTSTSSLPCESTGPSATVRWFIAPPCGYTGATVVPRPAPSGREGWTGSDAHDLALVPSARRIWRPVGTALSDEQPVDGKNTSAGENARERHRGVREIRFDAVPLARRQLTWPSERHERSRRAERRPEG